MPEENKTVAVVEPKFEPTHQFDFVGKNGRAVPIYNAQKKKGKGAGEEYLVPRDLDKWSVQDYLDVFDGAILVDEILYPRVNNIALKTSQFVLDACKDSPDQIPDKWRNYFAKLSIAETSRRALKLQQTELLGQLPSLMATPVEFEKAARQLAEIQIQLDKLEAEDQPATQEPVKQAA